MSVRLVGLERAQRFAGESFGHEELHALPEIGGRISQQARLFWIFAGTGAFVALGVILLH